MRPVLWEFTRPFLGGYFLCQTGQPARANAAWGHAFRFFLRFARFGDAALGTEKERIFRVEFSLARVGMASRVHLELLNPMEARLVYLVVRVSQEIAFNFVLNLGSRYTKASMMVRAEAQRNAMIAAERQRVEERVRAAKFRKQMDKANMRRGLQMIHK